MKVFVMWSGERSEKIATETTTFFEHILKGVKFFVSNRDIEPGQVWEDALAQRLKEAHVGIVCITPKNQDSRWMHFEAGAISKMPQSLVCPLLIEANKVEGPLGRYQATDALDKEAVFRLVKSLNNARPERKQSTEPELRKVFEEHWHSYSGGISSAEELPDRPTR